MKTTHRILCLGVLVALLAPVIGCGGDSAEQRVGGVRHDGGPWVIRSGAMAARIIGRRPHCVKRASVYTPAPTNAFSFRGHDHD